MGAAEAVISGRTPIRTTPLRAGRSSRVPSNFRRYAVFTVGLTGNRTGPRRRSVRAIATGANGLPTVRASSRISRWGMSIPWASSLPRTRLSPSPTTTVGGADGQRGLEPVAAVRVGDDQDAGDAAAARAGVVVAGVEPAVAGGDRGGDLEAEPAEGTGHGRTDGREVGVSLGLGLERDSRPARVAGPRTCSPAPDPVVSPASICECGTLIDRVAAARGAGVAVVGVGVTAPTRTVLTTVAAASNGHALVVSCSCFTSRLRAEHVLRPPPERREALKRYSARRITTLGKPAVTESVSATFSNPALSNSARVPT